MFIILKFNHLKIVKKKLKKNTGAGENGQINRKSKHN